MKPRRIYAHIESFATEGDPGFPLVTDGPFLMPDDETSEYVLAEELVVLEEKIKKPQKELEEEKNKNANLRDGFYVGD